MTNLMKLILVGSLLTCGTAFGKSKFRKPSSANAIECSISSEVKNGYTGYFLVAGGVREDEGAWMSKVNLYKHLAELQDDGYCKKDNKVLPVSCVVMSETKNAIVAYYVSVDGSDSSDGGVWINGKIGADNALIDLQKAGVCK